MARLEALERGHGEGGMLPQPLPAARWEPAMTHETDKTLHGIFEQLRHINSRLDSMQTVLCERNSFVGGVMFATAALVSVVWAGLLYLFTSKGT